MTLTMSDLKNKATYTYFYFYMHLDFIMH